MGKKLYLECYSGISGDMTAAALLDLGADQEVLKKVLDSLPVQGFTVEIKKVIKSGIAACDFDVKLDEIYENHDHDMEYLHGEQVHEHSGHNHVNECHLHGEHGHEGHGHVHDAYGHAHGAHIHRGMREIREILAGAAMTERARALALRIFEILAAAEAKAHSVPVEEVHFHEVGAVDSIVDIVSVAVCLDNLNVTEVIVPELSEGQGTVRCQHGILPIPVPAVANIAADNHLKLRITEVKGELVTPTGAAIAAAVRTADKLPKSFVIEKIGIGAGKRQYECPGILRAIMLGEDSEEKDVIWKRETNIDDSTGENLGYVMDRLLKAGARDVHYIPVFMKKNRPAWILCVLCKKEDISVMEKIIFHETTTIGIRRIEMERSILEREQCTVKTPYGEVQVKICRVDGEKKFIRNMRV